MQAAQQRSTINFADSFKKSVSHFQELSESKKRDLELMERLEAQRQQEALQEKESA